MKEKEREVIYALNLKEQHISTLDTHISKVNEIQLNAMIA